MESLCAHNLVIVWPRKERDFESAVRGELATLFRVARRMAGNQDEAADLVQQTLVKAFGAWKRFDGQHLRSWLICIMRNEHLMRIRSERRTESLDDLEFVASVGTWEEIAWRDQAHRLLQHLDELPVDFRLPIVLCDIEGMQYEEAAAALEIPIGTVRSRLSRGRAMLRRMLGDPNEVLG